LIDHGQDRKIAKRAELVRRNIDRCKVFQADGEGFVIELVQLSWTKSGIRSVAKVDPTGSRVGTGSSRGSTE
jgi:hypothetical protein